jgi:hypothetical protein
MMHALYILLSSLVEDLKYCAANTNLVTSIEHRHIVLAYLYPCTTILAKTDRVLVAIATQVVTICATRLKVLYRDYKVCTTEV